LINNAGFGLFENFLDTPLKPQKEQLDVNVRALVTLTHAFMPDMVAANPVASSLLLPRLLFSRWPGPLLRGMRRECKFV
jgi:hypothetical protein